MKRFPVGFFDRLEMKFLKIVLPIILVSASLFFAIIEGFSATRAIEELNTKQQILAQRYSILISSWVWNLDRERIKMSLETLITDKSIVGAQVVNERGGELASAGFRRRGSLGQQDDHHLARSGLRVLRCLCRLSGRQRLHGDARR